MLLRVCLFVAATLAVAKGANDVIDLTTANFDQKVIQSDDVWLVEFFAPWCGHCKSLAPEWAKAATALKGIVKMGAVDMDQYKEVGQPYDIKGFPTIKVFGFDKKKPTSYEGARTAQGLVDGALAAVKTVANTRLGGGKQSSGGDKKSSGGGGGGGSKDNGDAVVELTSADFQSQVLDSQDFWLVEFFAPWCGHCKNLAPEWKKAANELKGIAKLGAVDATIHGDLGQKYGVQGYPTIKIFNAGKKTGSPENYEGGRTASAIVEFCKEKATENMAPPEVKELISASLFDEECKNKQICFIAALPPVSESGAKGRNTFITMLKALAHTYRSRPFGFLWTEGGAQAELEKSLDIRSGYPALVALNAKKLKYATFRLAFAEKSIADFINQLVVGKASTVAVSSLPAIATRTAWDGKDQVIQTVEEIDLSELENDEF